MLRIENGDALSRRKLHAYIEPPMALTADSARSLVEAAELEKCLLQIGYHRRSHPNYRLALSSAMRSDLFGEINIIKTH